MPKIPVNVGEPVRQGRLKGKHRLRCNEAPTYYEQYGSFRMPWTVIDGPEDLEGNDSVGRTISDFIQCDVSKAKSDKHAQVISNIYANFLDATGIEDDGTGIDLEDLVGVEVDAIIKPDKDSNNIPTDRIKRYLPIRDDEDDE